VAKHWHEQRRFAPQADAATRDRLLGRWHRAVDRAKGWEEAEPPAEAATDAPAEAVTETTAAPAAGGKARAAAAGHPASVTEKTRASAADEAPHEVAAAAART
jgi:hypothetical protein